MKLSLQKANYAVCRLAPNDALPPRFFSATRTPEELSIVCLEEDVPVDAKAERGWCCLKVEGILDFALTGILAGLSRTLADAGISIFAVSTFNTDYLLLKSESWPKAAEALRSAGHELT